MSSHVFHVTVDFPDDVIGLGHAFTLEQIAAIIDYFASLKIDRIYWGFYEPEMLRRPITTGDDPLSIACRLAHQRGIECYALFKPWETGVALAIPTDWPAGRVFTGVNGLMGLYPWCTDFVRKHPEMRLEHRDTHHTANSDPVICIKLVSSDNRPTAITAKDISIYTSRTNGGFTEYPRTWTIRELVEQRDDKPARVLCIEGISIPAEERYILVTCSRRSNHVTFSNRVDRLIELYGADGNHVKFVWDDVATSRFDMQVYLRMMNLLCRGETGLLEIPDTYGRDLPSSSFKFDLGHEYRVRGLDGPETSMTDAGGRTMVPGQFNGHIAAVRGRGSHVIGGLHPCYPEVREYWQGLIRHAVSCGVDGVDIRFANHSTWTGFGLEYGFNQPVVDEFRRRYNVDIRTERFNVEAWKNLNGEYLTLFLHEARALLRDYDKAMQIHINGAFDLPRTQHPLCIGAANNVPVCFAYPWKQWLAEGLADAVTLKDIRCPMVSDNEGESFGRRVCSVARDAGIPVYVDSWMGKLDGNHGRDENTDFIQRWLNVPGVAGSILYEASSIITYDRNNGKVEGSDAVRRFVVSMLGKSIT